MTVAALVGSTAPASTTGALVRAMAAHAPDGVTLDVFDSLVDLPLFVPGAEPAPPSVEALRARLAAADAALIATPEYAYGMPGALKNALDWLVGSGELYGMRVAAASASPSERGGDRALANLRQTLRALGAVEAAAFAVPFVREALAGGALGEALGERARVAFASLADG